MHPLYLNRGRISRHACLALLAIAAVTSLVTAEIAEWNWSMRLASESLACPPPDPYADYFGFGPSTCNASGYVHGFAVLSSVIAACILIIIALDITRWLARPIVYLRGPKTNSFERDVHDFRTGLEPFGTAEFTISVPCTITTCGALTLTFYLIIAWRQLHP